MKLMENSSFIQHCVSHYIVSNFSASWEKRNLQSATLVRCTHCSSFLFDLHQSSSIFVVMILHIQQDSLVFSYCNWFGDCFSSILCFLRSFLIQNSLSSRLHTKFQFQSASSTWYWFHLQCSSKHVPEISFQLSISPKLNDLN